MLFIFDWDGTLINSTGKIVASMQRAVEQVGLDSLEDHQIRGIIGLGLPEAIRQLYPGIGERDLEALRGAYSHHFIEADRVPCDFYPDVPEVMQRLRDDGHRLSVATGKSRRGLDRVLGNLAMERFFDTTRCADETASKPDPMMLHQILEELRVPGEEAVMVGDTAFDLEMARNAGIGSIAVSYGAHDRERLMPYRPHRCIDRFSDLLGWLETR